MIYSGIDFDTYFKNYPDENGFFGKYGGAYIAPELKNAMAADLFPRCSHVESIVCLTRD